MEPRSLLSLLLSVAFAVCLVSAQTEESTVAGSVPTAEAGPTEPASATEVPPGAGAAVTDAPAEAVTKPAPEVIPESQTTAAPAPGDPVAEPTAAPTTGPGDPVTTAKPGPVVDVEGAGPTKAPPAEEPAQTTELPVVGGADPTTKSASTDTVTVGGKPEAKTETPVVAGTDEPAAVTTADSVTEGVAAEITTAADPCVTHQTDATPERHFTIKGDHVNDRNKKGWYLFQKDGANAEIATECIKRGYCGSQKPYHLDLGAAELPANVGDVVKAKLCLPSPDETDGNCGCSEKLSVEIRKCLSSYIYKLDHLAQNPSSVCIKLPDENVSSEYLADNPVTTEPPAPATTLEPEFTSQTSHLQDTESITSKQTTQATTQQPTQSDTTSLSEYSNCTRNELTSLSPNQRKSIITLEMKTGPNDKCIGREREHYNQWMEKHDLKFRTTLAKYLNKIELKRSQTTVAPTTEATTEATTTTAATTAAATTAATTIAPAAETTKEEETTVAPPVEKTTQQAPTEKPTTSKPRTTTECREDVCIDDPGVGAAAPEPVHVGPQAPDTDPGGSGPAPGGRVKRADDDDTNSTAVGYTADDVIYVRPTPRLIDGCVMQLSIYVERIVSSRRKRAADNDAVSPDLLMEALDEMKNDGEINKKDVQDMYVGFPEELMPEETSSPSSNIWEAHRGLWIAVIALIILCIIVIILSLICFKCCGDKKDDAEKRPITAEEGKAKKKKKQKKQKPTVIENPISDEEMMVNEKAPMVEHANPAYSSNGGGHHLSHRDDDGWMVPMDQLSAAERGIADVENTKL